MADNPIASVHGCRPEGSKSKVGMVASVSEMMRERNAARVLRPAAALALPVVAVWLQGIVGYHLDSSHFLFLYPAAFFSAWIAGPVAGIAATLLSGLLACSYLFEPGPLPGTVAGHWLSLVIFVGTGIAFALAQARMSLSASRRAFADALRRSETRWKFALEGGGQGLWDWDIELGTVELSPVYKQILGYGADEDIGNSAAAAFARVHPDDRQQLDVAIDAHLRGDTPTYWAEFRVQCKDGSYVWVESRGMAIKSSRGQPRRMLGTHVDISRRKAAEAAVHDLTANLEAKVAERTQRLSEVTERLRIVLNSMAEGVVLVGQGGRVIEANPASERIVGLSRAELIGWEPTASMWKAVREDCSTIAKEDFPVNVTLRTGRPVRGEVIGVIRPDGGQQWLVLNVEPIASVEGGPAELAVVTFTDVTDRRAIDASLRSSELRWRFAIEGSGDGLWDWSVPDSRVFFSEQWKRMLGFEGDEVGDGLDEWSKRVHPDDLEATLETVQEHLDGRTPIYVSEHRVRCKDGGYRWILDRGMVMARDENGAATRFVGTHTDITERKQAEQELHQARDRMQLAIQIGRLGVWDWDRESGRLRWDEQSHGMFAVPEAVRRQGVDRAFWRSRVHPLDLEYAESRFRLAEQTGQPNDAIYRIVLPDGAVRHIQAALLLENGADGKPARMVCVNRDVTDSVEMESALRAVNAATEAVNKVLSRGKEELEGLVQARTVALTTALDRAEAADRAKSAFLATTSHELRTPLNAVIGFSSLILDEAMGPVDERQREPLEMIRRSGNQLLTIVKNILDITSIEADSFGCKLSTVELCELLGQQVAAARERADARGIDLQLAGCSAPLHVVADSERLGQVVHNLIDNAIRFTDRGHVRVAALIKDGLVEVQVEDTGVGIPADQMDKLFQAFQPILNQPGPRRAGTGLGLAVSRRLVEAMGGSLSADSVPLRGSRFKFTLLLADIRPGEGASS